MMFNKKMLGGCCVGLALLLSSEGFGTQKVKEYTIQSGETTVKITDAEIKDGVAEFDALKNAEELKEELTSSWAVLVGGYLLAKKDIEVPGIDKSAKMADVAAKSTSEAYDVYLALDAMTGGSALYTAIYTFKNTEDDSEDRSSSVYSSEDDDEDHSGSVYSASEEDEEISKKSKKQKERKERKKAKTRSSSSSSHDDEYFALTDQFAEEADLEKTYATILKDAGTSKEKLALDEEQKKLINKALAAKEDAGFKEFLIEKFHEAYAILKHYDGFYDSVQASNGDNLLRIRKEFIAKLGELAKVKDGFAGKNLQLTNEVEDLKKQLKEAKKTVEGITGKTYEGQKGRIGGVKLTVHHEFQVPVAENYGLYKLGKKNSVTVTEAGKIKMFNTDTHAAVIAADATTMKKVKDGELMIVEKKNEVAVGRVIAGTHDVYEIGKEGKYDIGTHVAVPFAQGKQYFDTVDGYQQAIAAFEGQTGAAQIVQDITNDNKKGNGANVKDAMEQELGGLWPAVEIAEKIIKHKDKPVADLASAQQFAQLVTDVVAGKWADTTANADNATDETVKGFITELKKTAAAKTATNLQAQGVGGAGTEDAIRVQLLHAKLAGHDANKIKTILLN